MSEYRWRSKTKKCFAGTATLKLNNEEEPAKMTAGRVSKMGKKITKREWWYI